MAEMERQAQRRRRNNIIGAVVGVVVVLGLIIGIGVAVLGGSSNKATTATTATSGSPSPSPSSTATTAAAKKCATVKPDPPAPGEPIVPQVKKPPTALVANNIKVGTGAEAAKGDSVTVKYVGVSCSTGKAFDASYTDGAKQQEFTFTLGQGQVIPGWDQGVAGMKVGGVRQLVIPPALGYGAQGSPPKIAPNETLNFVVTLDKVTTKS
jgi:peptidylprolyl isomerase